MHITFKEISEREYTIGYRVDELYEIYNDDNQMGHLAINRDCDDGIIIEWIEFNKEYRGKGLLRTVFESIFNKFERSELTFEASKSLTPMYVHIGAIELSYDDLRETTEFLLCWDA